MSLSGAEKSRSLHRGRSVVFGSGALGGLLVAILSVGAGTLVSACEDSPELKPPKIVDTGCVSCHEGVEHMHGPIDRSECVLCHGGSGQEEEKNEAHVSVPEAWEEIRGEGLPTAPFGFIKDFSSDQLSRIDQEYLRFINPSDLRVVEQTCGQCHEKEAATVPTSVMATNSGHYFPTLYLEGAQEDREAYYGAQTIEVEECDEAGNSCKLVPLRSPDQERIAQAIATLDEEGDAGPLEEVAYQHYLSKSCNSCHQSSYSRNNSPGLYRSSGCASCHVLYEEDGLYRGEDPTTDDGSPVHPLKHQITKAIPSEQCASCHFQGGRIGLLFRGIREGGFGDTPEFAATIDRPLYGHPPGFYIEDEDTRNDIDETPPDVHFQRGMHCADCHVGTDVHGDGKLHASSKTQVDLQCTDCHGGVRKRAQPDEAGRFLTEKGRHLPQLSLDDLGRVVLTGVTSGELHVVPQPSEVLEFVPKTHPMHAAMAPDENGWSHADSLTCDACHTSYNQQCVGCHVTYDLRLDQVDGQTGLETPGVAISRRGFTTLGQVLLGTRADGKIQSVIASQQVQLTVVGSEDLGGEGRLLIGEEAGDDDWPRGKFRGRGGTPHLGFAPFFQHTASDKPRTCDSCHREDESEAELVRVRGVYGFGTGEFSIPGAGGVELDPFRFLDEDGEQISPWQQPGTGPVSEAARERALGVVLSQGGSESGE